MTDLESLSKVASEKGMILVDHENISPLMKEYEDSMVGVEKLCQVKDPDEKPYESKYKARDLLDQLINKFDANKTIMMLESKLDVINKVFTVFRKTATVICIMYIISNISSFSEGYKLALSVYAR
jgi:hypothetical protein